MSNNKDSHPSTSTNAIDLFLQQADKLPQRRDSKALSSGRLLFALDATASRQASWDRACHLQAQMFRATDHLGGLELQLCYYQGFHQFHASPWLRNSQSLLQAMNAVQCVGGHTQLERVLDHSLQQHASQPIQAVIIIGDAIEEDLTVLSNKSGKLGLYGIPLFMFQEGHDAKTRQGFQKMARLSKGAYATFDDRSAAELADLLGAVATYTSGGVDALQQLHNAAAQHLLQQLKG